MKPTRVSLLVALTVFAVAAAYLIARVAYADLPTLPRGGPVALAVLAIVEYLIARSVRVRLVGGRPPGSRARPLTPIGVARLAAFARASSAAGALVLGGYAGLGVYTLRGLEKTAYARDAFTSATGVLAALLLVLAALALERACRVPRPPPATGP